MRIIEAKMSDITDTIFPIFDIIFIRGKFLYQI
jgi:hypothetical protein